MTVEQFRKFSGAQPFQPFAIHCADGRMFAILNSEFVTLSPIGRTISLLNADMLIEVVDMLLVTSVRPMNESELRRSTSR